MHKVWWGWVAVAACAVAFAAPSANASTTGYFTLQGVSTGTVATTGFAATSTYQGTIDCDWVNGGNVFDGNCTTAQGAEPFFGNYVADGNVWQMDGVIGPGAITGTVSGVCSTSSVFAPPSLHYNLNCHFVVR